MHHPPPLFHVGLVIPQCRHCSPRRRFQLQSSGKPVRSDAKDQEGLRVSSVKTLSRRSITLTVCIHIRLCIRVANDSTFRKIILTHIVLLSNTNVSAAAARLASDPLCSDIAGSARDPEQDSANVAVSRDHVLLRHSIPLASYAIFPFSLWKLDSLQ